MHRAHELAEHNVAEHDRLNFVLKRLPFYILLAECSSRSLLKWSRARYGVRVEIEDPSALAARTSRARADGLRRAAPQGLGRIALSIRGPAETPLTPLKTPGSARDALEHRPPSSRAGRQHG